jgi:hypothetical protein
VTHKEVAARLDTTQEQVSLVLKHLANAGHLTRSTSGRTAFYKVRQREIHDPDAPIINGVRVKRYSAKYADGYGLKLQREKYV